MQYSAKESFSVTTHHSIAKILDGDSIIVRDDATQEEKQVRLYGIDAPEIKKCRKLISDEAETHLAGGLLMELGRMALNFALTIAPPDTNCTLIQEKSNPRDGHGRTLAYLILPDGSCFNEIMVSEGFAKPYSEYYCERLHDYQKLNILAKRQKKGLYSVVPKF